MTTRSKRSSMGDADTTLSSSTDGRNSTPVAAAAGSSNNNNTATRSRSRSRSRSRYSRKVIENEVALPWDDLGEYGKVGKESSVRLLSVTRQREPLPAAWTNGDSLFTRSKRYVGSKLRSLSDGGSFAKHRDKKQEHKVAMAAVAAAAGGDGQHFSEHDADPLSASMPASAFNGKSNVTSPMKANHDIQPVKVEAASKGAVMHDSNYTKKTTTTNNNNNNNNNNSDAKKKEEDHSLIHEYLNPKRKSQLSSSSSSAAPVYSAQSSVDTSSGRGKDTSTHNEGTDHYKKSWNGAMATQGEGHRTTSTSSTSGPEEDGTHTTSVEKYERGDGCDTTERTETVTTRSTLPNGARQVEHTKRQSCAVDSSTTSEDEVSKSHVTHTSYTTSEKTRSETTDPPGVGVGVQGTEEGKMQSLSVERISGSKMTLIKIEAATPEAQKQMDEFLRSKGATLTLSAPAADRPPSPGSSSTSSSDAKKSKSIPSLTHQTSHQQQQQQGEVQIQVVSMGAELQADQAATGRKATSIPVLVTTTSESESDMERSGKHREKKERPKSFAAPPSAKEASPPPSLSHTYQQQHQPLLASADALHVTPSSSATPIAVAEGSRVIDIKRASSPEVSCSQSQGELPPVGHFVVVAIDFGTTFSGYAFSFTRDPDSIHVMRKWEGGDPGVINQKVPTILLLAPDGSFHSFGFTARDFFHDLDPQEAPQWHFFEKFKMSLHNNPDLEHDTMLTASSGKHFSALMIFAHSLKYFRDHALAELSDQSGTKILNEDVRWVITVPAIWKAPAKQFMRQAAYEAGIASPSYPDQLLIALEPEAASIYVRKLRMHQLVPDKPPVVALSPRKLQPSDSDVSVSNGLGEDKPTKGSRLNSSSDDDVKDGERVHASPFEPLPAAATGADNFNTDFVFPRERSNLYQPGTRYMVVDCGGGTVDITVHEMVSEAGNLLELHRASGGPYGSLGVDQEFEKLMRVIFGSDFIDLLKSKKPAGWVDFMVAFEARKRAASPFKPTPLNISLPFIFIDFYKKLKGTSVEAAIRKHGDDEIRWSSQGMLRLTLTAMRRFFVPVLQKIKQSVGDILNNPSVRDVKYMFLVGGFSESPLLQEEMRKEFGHLLNIIIPQECSLTVLKGAVCYGLDPTVVTVRKSRMTYGISVLNRYVPGRHPKSKLVHKDGADWCVDVFDKFVHTDQSVAVGDSILRSYAPARRGQKTININVYCAEDTSAHFVTDEGVMKCGTLRLELSDWQFDDIGAGPVDQRSGSALTKRREIQTRMIFGDTEIKVTALDVKTGKSVKAAIDFLNK